MSLATHVGYADQSRAASTALAVGEPPANPISAKKRNSAGGNLRERQRGAAGGARPPLGGQAARLRATLFAGNL